jgi:nuclear transcription factor Y alpha
MEYAQYPQQQHSSHAGYANSAAGASITSPTSHGINQHAVQTSPIITSQQQHQPGQAPAHAMYGPQYGVPQQSMQTVPYGMPGGIQAAAMAATAAATGSNYTYMHSDPSMPHTSPRLPNAKKDGRPSPRMNSISQIPGRRMSQVTSPGVPSAAPRLCLLPLLCSIHSHQRYLPVRSKNRPYTSTPSSFTESSNDALPASA